MDNIQDFTEFKVVVCDDDKKLTRKFPTYHDGIRLSHDDPQLKQIVEKAISDFKGTPIEVVVHAKYMWELHGST